MRTLFFFIIACLISTSVVYADSDGYYSTGKGVLVYEQKLSHPESIFLIYFGDKIGISDPIEIKLPQKINSNIQGLQIIENTLVVVWRDSKWIKNQSGKLVLSMDNIVSVTYDIRDRNHLQLLEHTTIPYNTEYKFQRPEGNLGLWSRPGIIDLKSSDNLHSYQLVMEVSTIDEKQLLPSNGLIYHEHKTKIIQKDSSGNVMLEKEIFKDVFQETVD